MKKQKKEKIPRPAKDDKMIQHENSDYRNQCRKFEPINYFI